MPALQIRSCYRHARLRSRNAYASPRRCGECYTGGVKLPVAGMRRQKLSLARAAMKVKVMAWRGVSGTPARYESVVSATGARAQKHIC